MKKSIKLLLLALMACATAFGQTEEVADENELVPSRKYGFTDADGNVVIPYQYDDALSFSEGLAGVDAGDSYRSLWGFIDVNGQMVIEPQFQSVKSFSGGLAAVNVSMDWWYPLWGFIDKSGQMVIEPKYQNVYSFTGELTPVLLDNKWGYIDRSGTMVIEPQFDVAEAFEEGLANVRLGDYNEGKWGCIDNTGTMVVEPVYEDKISFNGRSLAMTMVNGKEVIVDKKGKIVMALPDDEYCYFSEEFGDGGYFIKVGEKYGIINEKGWVFEPQFDDFLSNGGIALVAKDEMIGAIKKNGKWLFEPDENVHLLDLEGNIIWTMMNEKIGLLDGNGWLVEPKYDDIDSFEEGFASVLLDDKVGFVDTTGKVRIKPKFELVTSGMPRFEDGWAIVGKNDKAGFIDKKGNWMIQPVYDFVDTYIDGIAQAKINGKVGFINKKGEWVIQPLYDYVLTPFSDGMAEAALDEKVGFINENGEWVIEPQYDVVGYFSEGLLPVMLDHKCGFIDMAGNVVVPLQYEDVGGFSSMGLAPVEINKKWGFIDKTGKMVIEPQFDAVTSFDSESGTAWARIGNEETGVIGTIDKEGNFTPFEMDEDE